MIKSNSLQKYLLTFITFLLIGAGVCVFTSSTNVSAASCGAPGTCYGMRQNPPGGCGCYTNAEGCGGGCPGNPPNNPPACAPTPPIAGTLSSPANGATNLPKPVTLTWVNGAWGNGCPNTNYNRIFYKIKTADCNTLTNFSATAYFAGTTSHALNAELQWGTTYCWYVEQNNRADVNPAYSRFTARREFTVSKIPTYTGGGFSGVDVCGNQSSGRKGSPGVTNPIDWTANFNNPEPTNAFQWFIVALVPTTGTNGINTVTSDWATTYTKALQAGTFVFGINRSNAGVITYQSLQLSPIKWTAAGPSATSLNSANGKSTLEDLGTNTGVQITGANAASKFRISFGNTFPAGTYNMYVMTIVTNAGTLMASNDATATVPYQMRKAGTWKVDTAPPTATLSNPTLNANGTFNVIWTGTDNVGLTDLRSYIYSDTAGATLHDNTIGLDIVTDTIEQSYPTPSNAGVTGKNLGSHNYTDNSSSDGPEYNFKIYVRDGACNTSEYKVEKNPLTPWILGQNGDISGREGISKTKIPQIANFTIPFTTTTGPSYFSQYGSISGTTSNALGTISKYSEFANSYVDDSILEPHDLNSVWYDYLFDKVAKNQKTTIVPQPAKVIASGTTMSAALGASPDTKYGVEINGDLSIDTNVKCDLRALIFVKGSLSINPDFTIKAAQDTLPIINQAYNGCMFIVKGSASIGLGSVKTNLATSSSTLAGYDLIEAFILTDTAFNAPADGHGAGKKGDGLYINGGLVANSTMNGATSSIKRDIVQEGNNLQPATFFNLDPRYKLTFSEDFASRDYEIREYGL